VNPPFNYKKATQALNYLACRSGSKINKMKALKLVYFADRYHLRKYGRLITNDTYFAMEHGPVASGVKDLAEFSVALDKHEASYAKQYIRPVSKYTYESIADVDRDVFSDSDIEALKFAFETFGQLDKFKLRDKTHLYPEWKKHEQSLQKLSRTEMDIEGKRVRREQIREAAKIEALWR
jgi:uncharacterized phage-associated protein